MLPLHKNINSQTEIMNRSINQPFTAALELKKYLKNKVLSQLAPLKNTKNAKITEFSSILETLITNIVAFLEEYIINSKKDIDLIVSIKNLESMIKSQSSILGVTKDYANQLSRQGRQVTHDALTMQRTHEPYAYPPYPSFQSDPQQAQILQLQQQIQQLKEQSVPPAANAKTKPSLGGGYKNIQLFNIEFKKLLIKVDNINDNIKLSINEKKLRIKKLFNQFEKKIKTQVNKMKKETTNAIKLLKLTKLKKSKPKSRKKTVSKSKPKPRKKTVSKPKKNKVMN